MENATFPMASASGSCPQRRAAWPESQTWEELGRHLGAVGRPSSVLLFLEGRLGSLGTRCHLWALQGRKAPRGALDRLTLATRAALRPCEALSSMSSTSLCCSSAVSLSRSRCRGRWASSWDTGSHSPLSPRGALCWDRRWGGAGGAPAGGCPTSTAPWAPPGLCRGSG